MVRLRRDSNPDSRQSEHVSKAHKSGDHSANEQRSNVSSPHYGYQVLLDQSESLYLLQRMCIQQTVLRFQRLRLPDTTC